MRTIEIPACGICRGNCYGCFYADECLQWLDVSPYTPATVTVNCVRLALCESRHQMPDEVEGSIFPQSIDPTDLLKIRATCKRSLDTALMGGIKHLVVYVTGLTVALMEVVNYCHRNNINLVLMHFNRQTGEYYPQDVD